MWATPAGQRVSIVVNHVGADASRTVMAAVRRVLLREGIEIDVR